MGSWAGAFGQTQFMPSTFLRIAVDLDGDGRRDIVDSVARRARLDREYPRKRRLGAGQPWGFEVRLPSGYSGPAGRKRKRPLSQWARAGVRRVDGRPLPGGSRPGCSCPPGRAARPSW